MTGQDVFESLMAELTNPTHGTAFAPHKKISRAEFEEWQKVASFDIMKGMRYGQSFCNHFGVTDNILYYEFSWLNAEEYIKKAYIK